MRTCFVAIRNASFHPNIVFHIRTGEMRAGIDFWNLVCVQSFFI